MLTIGKNIRLLPSCKNYCLSLRTVNFEYPYIHCYCSRILYFRILLHDTVPQRGQNRHFHRHISYPLNSLRLFVPMQRRELENQRTDLWLKLYMLSRTSSHQICWIQMVGVSEYLVRDSYKNHPIRSVGIEMKKKKTMRDDENEINKIVMSRK